MTKNLLLIFLTCILTLNSFATNKTLKKSSIKTIDSCMNAAIKEHIFPGAQMIVGNKEGVIFNQNYGNLDYTNNETVNDQTLYDLASCTKIFATTLAVMRLIDEQKLSLTTKISDVIEGADTMPYARVMIKDLLYHGSGFSPTVSVARSLVKSANEKIPLISTTKTANNPYCFDTKQYICKDIAYDTTYLTTSKLPGSIKISSSLYLKEGYKLKLDTMINEAYNIKKYGYYSYSDLNFYFLQKIIEATTACSINEYVQSIYEQMGIKNIGYNPLSWSESDMIAPTEYDVLFRRDTLRGIVHDEMACIQGGMAGHAGLFASATTLSELCQMFINNGVAANGERIISTETLATFTKVKTYASGVVRGLGFDKMNPTKTSYTSASYGHTGYTGTYFWIEPNQDFYVILLTNRVHPTRANKKLTANFRSFLWEVVESNFKTK
ncbi:MAG: serine hydrolase [Rikenellaceae bacterium]